MSLRRRKIASMNLQTLLAVAAVVGPLAGVLLGTFLGSRYEAIRWFRDRRLEAFVAAHKAQRDMFIVGSLLSTGELLGRDRNLAELEQALLAWTEAALAIDLLGGGPVVLVTTEVNAVLLRMSAAARKGDSKEWGALAPQLVGGGELRQRFTEGMRKELAPDSRPIRWLARFG